MNISAEISNLMLFKLLEMEGREDIYRNEKEGNFVQSKEAISAQSPCGARVPHWTRGQVGPCGTRPPHVVAMVFLPRTSHVFQPYSGIRTLILNPFLDYES